jgi:hypothetical protein
LFTGAATQNEFLFISMIETMPRNRHVVGVFCEVASICSPQGGLTMKRTALAFAVAALTLAAVSVSQAAPVAPLAAGVAAGNNVTHVQYWRWHHRHHHCWVGPYGHWHCRWW